MEASKQKEAARHFAEIWAGKGYEKGETQKFWIQLMGEVLGIAHPTEFIQFEAQVKLDHTSFIDVYIPATHVLIEQKGIHRDLNEKIKQSDGTFLTPEQQVQRYSAALPYSSRPRWIVTCNFKEFHVYDMEHPQEDPAVILLQDLPTEYYRLQFLVSTQSESLKKEMEISLQAGNLVGKIHAALMPCYLDATKESSQQSLNQLCVRLVFCLYAEDFGLFGSHTAFHDYLVSEPAPKLRNALRDLFAVLNTPVEERDPYLEENLAAFPYVNGGLFQGDIEIPQLTEEIKDLILHKGSEDFDWSKISPTIFGAVFESTLNPETRRKGGMHYTSIENIHKVIDPLFLDDLREEFAAIKGEKVSTRRKQRLEEFQTKLSGLCFLDPACGSGNFLTESYISLRRLENEVLQELYGLQIVLGATENPIKVSIGQFYGMEINDFAVTVARTALWIAESQMMEETAAIVSFNGDFLPLKNYAHIIEGNALQLDWQEVLPKEKCSYIMGNPPFVGHQWRTAEQASDMDQVCREFPKHGKLDYVCAWYAKAAEYMQGTALTAAFVSTNSIVQGESVAALWQPMTEKFSAEIQFAYRPFVWSSESSDSAAVHCVIIGFSCEHKAAPKRLFSEKQYTEAQNINGYLLNAPNFFVQSRGKSLCGFPKMSKGSQPTDGGHLILSEEERQDLLAKYPAAEPFIRRFVSGGDFINNKIRYCLWLVGVAPNLYRKISPIMSRLEKVADVRRQSPTQSVQRAAENPMLFTQIRQPKGFYLGVPAVSSCNRRYIPIGYLQPEVVASDQLYLIPDATLFMFGVMTSNVHMSWARVICGRLKSDYRYTPAVYNNFPWPLLPSLEGSARGFDESNPYNCRSTAAGSMEGSARELGESNPYNRRSTAEGKLRECEQAAALRADIEKTAQGILDARALYPDCSLADLYDESTMPPELRRAHQANDRAVMKAYGFPVKHFTESDCVAALMKLYQQLAEK